MGSAQSTLSGETVVVVAALAVAGAAAVGYTTLGPSASDSGSSLGSKEKDAKKKSKRKSTAAAAVSSVADESTPGPAASVPGGDAEPVDPAAGKPKSGKSKKSKSKAAAAAPSTTTSALLSTGALPGAFDSPGDAEENAPPAPVVKAHSKKEKKKDKGKKEKQGAAESGAQATPAAAAPSTPTPPAAVPAAAAQGGKAKKAKGKKKGTSAGAASTTATAGESTDDGWTRVGSASASLTEDSLPEAEEDDESEAEEIPLPGMRPKNVDPRESLKAAKPKRPLAERLLPKPRKTGVDDMLPADSPDYPAIARVMRVVPGAAGAGERTPLAASTEDPIAGAEVPSGDESADVEGASEEVGGSADEAQTEEQAMLAALAAADAADAAEAEAISGLGDSQAQAEDDGEWGFVPVKRRGANASTSSLTHSASFGNIKSGGSGSVVAGSGAQAKKNAKRKEAEKAAKAAAEEERLAALAKHRRGVEGERMAAQQKSAGNPKVSGGMSASVDAGGRLVWDD
ncbi:hypothetical protein C8R47DRAFT_1109155 [Mycena vitilis]|nr:hypothetical protein C8R47DRAFT_1109155 [Mycena vitilis]